jgi:uncharacterized protein YdhG (YjbR/CyaY superfamily)
MKTEQAAPKDIDEYIAGFPNGVREILGKIRITIRKAAPHAEETISYRIPTFQDLGHSHGLGAGERASAPSVHRHCPDSRLAAFRDDAECLRRQ